jgi:hypothetical protein
VTVLSDALSDALLVPCAISLPGRTVSDFCERLINRALIRQPDRHDIASSVMEDVIRSRSQQ